MAHKQLFGLKNQLGLVNYQLEEVGNLEAEAPKADATAPFGVVMSATVVELSLNQARHLLEEAASILQGEIDFYEESDRQIADSQSSNDAALTDSLTKAAQAREALTAGRAAYCMQSVCASTVFKLKGMETARSYRR
jgi:hypothetical protein